MIFDFSPLALSHLFAFLGSFLVVYLLVESAVKRRHHSPRYVGALLVAVISILAYVVVQDTGLHIGLLGAALLVVLVGTIDEHVRLNAGWQLVWQTVAATAAVTGGWAIPYMSNPFAEGVIRLDWVSVGPWIIPGSIVAVVWLVFLINAVNWLDGSDGLAGSVAAVAFLTLAAISLLPATQDSRTLSLALIGAGATLAFLVWNFPPAKVLLGTTGSWFVGLFLGLVALVGGGKIATTILVLAIPVVDTGLVIVQRLVARRPVWQADTSHLHHHLRAVGISARGIAAASALVSAGLGAAAIALQTYQKLWAFGAVAAVLCGMVVLMIRRTHGT